MSEGRFGWRYLDAAGSDVGGSASFEGREAAEAWLAEAWAELSDRGVEAVELVDHATAEPLYRMDLAEG